MKNYLILSKTAVFILISAGMCGSVSAVLQSSGNESNASKLVSANESPDARGTSVPSADGNKIKGKMTLRFVPPGVEPAKVDEQPVEKGISDDKSRFMSRDPRLVDPTVKPAFLTKIVTNPPPVYHTQQAHVVNNGNVNGTSVQGSSVKVRSKTTSASAVSPQS